MSPRFDTLPNVEAAVNTVLHAEGIRAYSSIPGTPTFPLVVSMRLGGIPAERHVLDRPRIQVEVWGGGRNDGSSTSKSELLDLAREAWRLLHEAEGTTVELSNDEAVFIAGVDAELGLQWLPDPPTGRPRYIFAVRVAARNAVLAS